MPRLTIKNELLNRYENNGANLIECLQKLGELESLEEKLEVDLVQYLKEKINDRYNH